MESLARMCLVPLIAASACSSSIKVGTNPDDSCCADQDAPPEIACQEIPDGQPIGEEVAVQCTVTDDQRVFMVTVNYASETSTYWQDATLHPVDDVWMGEIPRDDVTGGGMYSEQTGVALHPDART